MVCTRLPYLARQLLESVARQWGGPRKEDVEQQIIDKILVILAYVRYTGAMKVRRNEHLKKFHDPLEIWRNTQS